MKNPTPGYKPDPVRPPQFNTWLPQELQHDLRVTAAEIDKPLYAVTAAAIDIGLRVIKKDLDRPERKPQLMKYINRFLSQSALAAANAELKEEEEEASPGLDPDYARLLFNSIERSRHRKHSH